MQIPEEIQNQVKQELGSISNEVVLKVFTSDSENCNFCKDTVELTQAVASLVDKLSVEILDVEKNKDEAEQYGVERSPAILLQVGRNVLPIRFYGIPAGYEFSSLIESIKFAGTGTLQLSEEVIEKVKAIQSPKKIQSFVTVSCPYCPPAVIIGFQFALVNPEFISAEMVEASQFPELSTKVGVRAVPKVVINDSTSFEGSLQVEQYLEKLLEA